MDYTVHEILQARIQPIASPGDLPNLGIKSRSPALQGDSLLSEPLGKPRNTGVDSLSLLQWIFLIQESNWGLLHCRQILDQLGYQGSPDKPKALMETHGHRLMGAEQTTSVPLLPWWG